MVVPVSMRHEVDNCLRNQHKDFADVVLPFWKQPNCLVCFKLGEINNINDNVVKVPSINAMVRFVDTFSALEFVLMCQKAKPRHNFPMPKKTKDIKNIMHL